MEKDYTTGVKDGDLVRVNPEVGGSYAQFGDGRIYSAKFNKVEHSFELTDIRTGKKVTHPIDAQIVHRVVLWHSDWLIPVSKFEARIHEIIRRETPDGGK